MKHSTCLPIYLFPSTNGAFHCDESSTLNLISVQVFLYHHQTWVYFSSLPCSAEVEAYTQVVKDSLFKQLLAVLHGLVMRAKRLNHTAHVQAGAKRIITRRTDANMGSA